MRYQGCTLPNTVYLATATALGHVGWAMETAAQHSGWLPVFGTARISLGIRQARLETIQRLAIINNK